MIMTIKRVTGKFCILPPNSLNLGVEEDVYSFGKGTATMFYNLFDSHNHSENSPDGAHSVTFMVENAIDRGIQGIAITDHCEGDSIEQDNAETRLRQSALDVAMARVAFRNRIIVTCGIELGQPRFNWRGAEQILAMQPFDFVLLSLHRLQGWQDFFLIDYSQISEATIHNMMTTYFDELLEIVKWGRFDILAHLSLPLRYAKIFADRDIDLTRYREAIDAVLRQVVSMGKGIEINSSGLFNALESTLPPAWVVRRYRELGGQFCTIGSDSHRAGDIGRGIGEGMQLLLDAGFQYFAFYRDRQPVMLRII